MQSVSGIPATFAAGCFWGTERFFLKHFGNAIVSHRVGYMGGEEEEEVTYPMVKTGRTGHAEVLHIEYDPTKVSFADLLHFFFRMHNPTTRNRQAGDVGTQYRSTIFYHNDEQLREAKDYIARLNGEDPKLHAALSAAFGDAEVVTTVEKAARLYTAEEYHQNFLEKNPDGYCAHRIYW